VAKSGMATDSRGTAPGTKSRLIYWPTGWSPVAWWPSGVPRRFRRYQSIGSSNLSDPILTF